MVLNHFRLEAPFISLIAFVNCVVPNLKNKCIYYYYHAYLLAERIGSADGGLLRQGGASACTYLLTSSHLAAWSGGILVKNHWSKVSARGTCRRIFSYAIYQGNWTVKGKEKRWRRRCAPCTLSASSFMFRKTKPICKVSTNLRLPFPSPPAVIYCFCSGNAQESYSWIKTLLSEVQYKPRTHRQPQPWDHAS